MAALPRFQYNNLSRKARETSVAQESIVLPSILIVGLTCIIISTSMTISFRNAFIFILMKTKTIFSLKTPFVIHFG